MDTHFVTHEVLNQVPVLDDRDLMADGPFLRALRREGPAGIREAVASYAVIAGCAQAAEWARQANGATPVLQTHDACGFRCDGIEFHPAYHALMRTSMSHGVHRLEAAPGAYVKRAAKLYLAAQMEAGHCCPLTMTNAAVPVLALEPSLQAWREKAAGLEYDPAFRPLHEKTSVTLGMGMTEKQGGSDVRSNTTRAEPEGARGSGQTYRISGHKWFMSAPMCDAFLILAQAEGGLTCFLLPRFRKNGSVNAIHFQRLKTKLGNCSNASSEVEFAGAEAVAIGGEGEGTRVIIGMVGLTRCDCAVSSAALMRQALAYAIHHARNRTAFQKRLIDQPLMANVLADLALDVEAAVALAFHLARAFDNPPLHEAQAWQRLMTPVVKYWVCKTAPPFVAEAMECLGGNGYVESGPLARIYREVPVNSIWEGSGNIMALDVVRVLRRDAGMASALLNDLEEPARQDKRTTALLKRVSAMIADQASHERNARAIAEGLALLAAALLLQAGAPSDIADGFMARRFTGDGMRLYGSGDVADAGAIIAHAT